VYEERLIAYPKGLPQTWFERSPIPDSEESNWYFGPQLKGEKRRLVSVTRPDVLFLSVAATFNHEQLAKVYERFSSRLLVIDVNRASEFLEQWTAERVKEDRGIHAVIKNFLQVADLGIVDMSVEEKSFTEDKFSANLVDEVLSVFLEGKYFDIQLRHGAIDRSDISVPFSIEDESFGTRRFFGLSGPWIDTVVGGFILVVDELDTSLHPVLVRSLVEAFHNLSVTLSSTAQLIFNTHDTTLLDPSLFRRDQIWFVEKDNFGASHLYPLLDFSPRKDESLAKGYLQGRYGAIPFIGELSPGLIANAEK
jgi:hypothetical protein